MEIEICSPDGLKASEVKAITAIKNQFRNTWRGYASFLVNDRQGSMEIDLLLITHDRFILCEIKEWAGVINSDGRQWTQTFIDGKTRTYPSPVYIKRQHAQRLGSLFDSELKNLWGGFYIVDYAIILSGSSKLGNLPDSEKKVVFTLDEFLKLNDSTDNYNRMLPMHRKQEQEWLFNTGQLKRPNEDSQIKIFENWFKGGNFIKPKHRLVEGFLVPDSDKAIFKHPKNFYTEYNVEHHEQAKLEALLRCWDFSQLWPYGLDQASRARIALRERRVIEYVEAEAPQVQKDYLMSPRHSSMEGEIEEDFIEVYQHPPLTRLDTYINKIDTPAKKINLIRDILTPFVELHKLGIAHRDISLERLWFADYSKSILLSGFMTAKFPENISKVSVSDIREFMSSSAIPMPEEKLKSDKDEIDALRMDVYQLGAIIYRVAFGEDIKTDETSLQWQNPREDQFNGILNKWIKKSIEIDPSDRYRSAQDMMEEFSKLDFSTYLPQADDETVMRELAGFYQSGVIPYVQWPPLSQPENREGRQSYDCKINDAKCILKLWPALLPKPGESSANRKIYNFLTRCQLAQRSQLNIAAPLDFGISENGLYLIIPSIEGKTWEQYCQEQSKDEEGLGKRLSISQKLVSSIKRLHESDLAHGDLKPDNIIVTVTDGEEDGLLIDFFDMDQNGNPLYNTEYAPQSQHGPFGRDIYATYCIVDEMFSRCGEYAKDIRAEIRRAIGQNSQDVPVSLTPLQETLLNAGKSGGNEVEEIILYMGKRTSNKTSIAPYSVDYYVTKDDMDARNSRIFINGAKEKIAIYYDTSGGKRDIKHIKSSRISPSELFKESGNKFAKKFRCNLLCDTGNGDNTNFFNKIFELFDDGESSITQSENTDGQMRGHSQSLGSIWEQLHREEFERYPKVTVLECEELSDKVLSVEIEENIDTLEMDKADIIEVTDGDPDHPWRFGELDLSRSHGNKLIIKKSGYKKIRRKGVLQLRDQMSVISWTRRKDALARILRQESLIPDLLSLFEKGESKSRQKIRDLPEPSLDLWELYGKYLDSDKMKAFKHILSGQLNVIMGPPGTGKTTLLSVLLDYLVRLPDIGRILLVSQSHIAVNEVAERARHVMNEVNGELGKGETDISCLMIRLGDREKVSDKLLDIHVDALQCQYRTAFLRDLENRLAALAKRLMLPTAFILEAASLYRNIGSELHQYGQLNASKPQGNADEQSISRRKQRIYNLLYNKFSEYTDSPESIFESSDMQKALLNCIASRYKINNPCQISKLNSVLSITHQWYLRLSADSDSFAGFMARTRKLVIGTLVGIGKSAYDIASHRYDIAIIDEAARASASELAVAMQSARRVILVGDHKQLLPHYDIGVINDVARKLKTDAHEVAKTDFERAYKCNDGIMLSKQYRMQEPICSLISEVFYDGRLTTGIDREACIGKQEPWNSAVCWIDTSNLNITEQSIGTSKANEMESNIICCQLKCLTEDDNAMGTLKEWSENGKKYPIGIITGYSQQVKELKRRLDEAWADPIREMIRIDTIDSYQGSENRIIILSLVRDNPKQKTGFMNDESRINVALSRAKNHLLIVGASRMWQNSPCALNRVFTFIKKKTLDSTREYQIINLDSQMEN
ncbi:AAA domain-containing protein [Desulfovibrio sp. ZJ369]|uniref:AAA domain-containing protein n=1 Tax=Desulfovibrio sp. ZJ369 TaxID=2709793 RepID=UPI0013EB2D68|nr:AAA domain-containing protein [Desulfovibrio sp. ZJ369]